MKKTLCSFTAMILVSCATPQPIPVFDTTKIDQHLKQLEDEHFQFRFDLQINDCFVDYHGCLLAGKKNKDDCWDAHEQCVITAHKLWQKAKKDRNIK